MTKEQEERAKELVVLIHTALNHPSKSDPVWTTYEAERAQRTVDAVWELGLILGCAPGQRTSKLDRLATASHHAAMRGTEIDREFVEQGAWPR